jgi:site-specific DNA-methyltransferase (adenine-specific)
MTVPYTLLTGDCIEMMRGMPDASVDSIVCDPPYHLTQVSRGGHARTNNPEMPHGRHRIGDKGFMGKVWDGGDIAHRVEMWAECLRVLKPGGHLLAFSSTRTYHRMTCAIEDAGFEVRDQFAWVYGSGFPKSRNLSGDWQGWGTAVKPAWEPIAFARKPFRGTVEANVLQHGTGALHIDACRVGYENDANDPATNPLYRKQAGYANANAADDTSSSFSMKDGSGERNPNALGRWPANIIHDGSPEVLEQFPDAPGQMADVSFTAPSAKTSNVYGAMQRAGEASQDARYTDTGGTNFAMKPGARRLDTGSAARFFYCAKASRADRNEGIGGSDAPAVSTEATMRDRETADWQERNGNHHPTVKPTDLMAYLCRLVTPPGGTVLDPFMGSGSTGKAAMREGFRFVGIDMTPEYVAIAEARIKFEYERVETERIEASRQPDMFAEVA